MEDIARSAVPADVPETDLPEKALGFRVQLYGMTKHRDLFTPRQLVALTTFSDLVMEAREKVLEDALAAGLPDDGQRLAGGGTGASAYADAIAVFLGIGIDRVAYYGSTLAGWLPKDNAMRDSMPRQALAMSWNYAEANPFGKSSGSYKACIAVAVNYLELIRRSERGEIQQNAAQLVPQHQAVIVCTDPPYYDNIGYADLSDFFYVWLRRSLKTIYPDLFQTMLVPKAEELVATPYRHDGKENAETFFLDGMKRAIRNMVDQSDDGYPTTLFYAFKQAEVEQEGIASTGWATFLEAVGQSGFAVVGTYPIKTESGNRISARGTNALASSIVLVCRKRVEDAPVTTRTEFLRELREELPAALHLLQQSNIAPVDMAQASIGPGMAIFTRHAKVLEADDFAMTVKTALRLINRALDEYLSEQEADYDADTRFAITWFETRGMDAGPFGEAETLATARGVSVQGVVESGIFEARAGNARLLGRDELVDGWSPEGDARFTVWEGTQYLIRALENEGEDVAAALLSRLGANGEVARELAYRLYGICERKGWAEEGRAYNALVAAWPTLLDLAAKAGAGPAQSELGV